MFRIDTVNKYSKDIAFPDAEIRDPKEETQPASKYYSDGPLIHEFLREMKDVFDRYNAITVGELSHFWGTEEDVMSYISARSGQLNMVFNVDIANLGEKSPNLTGRFSVGDFKLELSGWQAFASNPDAWTTVLLENHYQPRSISRFGSDSSSEDRVRSGKMLAMIMATMTGTMFLYQGQEIGMVNAPRSWPAEDFKDVRSVSKYNQLRDRFKDDPERLATKWEAFLRGARDHPRLPMQWDDGESAGFTSAGVIHWMRVHDDWNENNVKKQMRNQSSLLEFWRRILHLRKDYKDLFIYGRYRLLEIEDEDLFAFVRT